MVLKQSTPSFVISWRKLIDKSFYQFLLSSVSILLPKEGEYIWNTDNSWPEVNRKWKYSKKYLFCFLLNNTEVINFFYSTGQRHQWCTLLYYIWLGSKLNIISPRIRNSLVSANGLSCGSKKWQKFNFFVIFDSNYQHYYRPSLKSKLHTINIVCLQCQLAQQKPKY